MTGDNAPIALFLVLALSLPLSALLVRRIPARRMLMMALLWAVIIAGLALTVRLFGFAAPPRPIIVSTPPHFT